MEIALEKKVSTAIRKKRYGADREALEKEIGHPLLYMELC